MCPIPEIQIITPAIKFLQCLPFNAKGTLKRAYEQIKPVLEHYQWNNFACKYNIILPQRQKSNEL